MNHDPKLLQGFDLETGMACSIGSLFRFSPAASAYEPRLFTELLPALRRSFVITLYIRTDQADSKGDVAKGRAVAKQQKLADPIIECAFRLEQQQRPRHQNFVWLVSTDSPVLKEWMQKTYASNNRQVLSTGSRGHHSKASAHPSTQDFAEAMIDWMLIGESDVVVTYEQFTFGGTASLRTARPYFRAETNQCLQLSIFPE